MQPFDTKGFVPIDLFEPTRRVRFLESEWFDTPLASLGIKGASKLCSLRGAIEDLVFESYEAGSNAWEQQVSRPHSSFLPEDVRRGRMLFVQLALSSVYLQCKNNQVAL